MSMGKSHGQYALEREQAADKQKLVTLEMKAKKEKERAQKLFVRQARATSGGGFFSRTEQNSTLG